MPNPSSGSPGAPLVGSVGLRGAHLWFADAALRGELPLAPTRP